MLTEKYSAGVYFLERICVHSTILHFTDFKSFLGEMYKKHLFFPPLIL